MDGMIRIKGVFRDINEREKTTTLQSGDVVAFDPERNCIAFIRPWENRQYGIDGWTQSWPDHLYFLAKLAETDFIDITLLLSAATGLSAEKIDDYSAYKWAFRFVKKE